MNDTADTIALSSNMLIALEPIIDPRKPPIATAIVLMTNLSFNDIFGTEYSEPTNKQAIAKNNTVVFIIYANPRAAADRTVTNMMASDLLTWPETRGLVGSLILSTFMSTISLSKYVDNDTHMVINGVMIRCII